MNDGDAFLMASQMEKRAIRMYERMRDLIKDKAMLDVIGALLKDERDHLVIFNKMLGSSKNVSGLAPLLDAQADSILFAGGLTEAFRGGAVKNSAALIDYAIKQEEIAIKTYEDMAEKCTESAAASFMQVAAEEKRHLASLKTMKEQ